MSDSDFGKRFGRFVRSLVSVSRTCGFEKAFRRGACILLQNIAGPPREETIVTTKNGHRMFLIPCDGGISTELKTFKVHEPLATGMMMKELKPGITVVDIGSNIGYYVILESKLVGKDGTVVAIEPIRRNFQYLLKNIKLNHLNNVKAMRVALSNRKGVVNMRSHNYSNWSRVLENGERVPSRIEQVMAVTGDKLLEPFENIGLIRLDVEGHEDRVIDGCSKIIQRWLPDILIEVHSNFLGRERLQNLLRKFRRYGYITKYFIPRDLDFALVAKDDDVVTMPCETFLSHDDAQFTIFLRHSSKWIKNL